MELQHIRKHIDDIDNDILNLIAQRMSYMHKVAQYKKEHGLPIFDVQREEQLLIHKKQVAQQLGLCPKLAEDVFTLIMDEAKKLQKAF
ncbi:MAG: chorismate mutase [Candidatus Woesearchaeota archaeon]